MSKNFSVKKVDKLNSRRIWEIRNHPLNRKNSNNAEEISWDSHESWFEKKYFSGENNYCFVLYAEEKVIGYCRLDKNIEDNYVVSVALDPGYQGRGLGYKLLEESLKIIPPLVTVLAEVHRDNIPSLKLFQKSGFKMRKEDERVLWFEYKGNNDLAD